MLECEIKKYAASIYIDYEDKPDILDEIGFAELSRNVFGNKVLLEYMGAR